MNWNILENISNLMTIDWDWSNGDEHFDSKAPTPVDKDGWVKNVSNNFYVLGAANLENPSHPPN